MAILGNKKDNKCWSGCGERGIIDTVVGVQDAVATVEISLKFSQKPKGFYDLIHRHLYIHVLCCSVHSSQEIEST